MAGQGPSRRELLQALACASVAGAAGGFSRWAYAFAGPESQHVHTMPGPGSSARKDMYHPRFFTPDEFRTIVLLAEHILPATHSDMSVRAGSHPVAMRHAAARAPVDAGATDAGVAEFIDFMVKEDVALQAQFRGGLAWLDRASSSGHFRSSSASDQVRLLERLAYKSKAQTGDEAGRSFFSLMRRYTVMGFYTSRIGLESLDYPGLRFYADSPKATDFGTLLPRDAVR